MSAGHNVEVELAGDESQAGGEEDHGDPQDWPGEQGGVESCQASTDQPYNEEYWSQEVSSNDVRLSDWQNLQSSITNCPARLTFIVHLIRFLTPT